MLWFYGQHLKVDIIDTCAAEIDNTTYNLMASAQGTNLDAGFPRYEQQFCLHHDYDVCQQLYYMHMWAVEKIYSEEFTYRYLYSTF